MTSHAHSTRVNKTSNTPLKLAIAAIMQPSPTLLKEIMGKYYFEQKWAVAVLMQAFRRDGGTFQSATTKVGIGLTRAVFEGVHLYQRKMLQNQKSVRHYVKKNKINQKALDTLENAGMLFLSTALQFDEPQLLSILFKWIPDFEIADMHHRADKADKNGRAALCALATTHGALKCAEWLQQNIYDTNNNSGTSACA